MDIDFITDLTRQFSIEIGDSPRGVEGNRALLNRFEITFLTKTRRYLLNGDTVIVDTFGGDAAHFISRPQVLNDVQGIAAAMSVAIDKTIESLKGDEPAGLPNTEKLDTARLLDITVGDDGFIYAQVEVLPVEKELFDVLKFNLPITRQG